MHYANLVNAIIDILGSVAAKDLRRWHARKKSNNSLRITMPKNVENMYFEFRQQNIFAILIHCSIATMNLF